MPSTSYIPARDPDALTWMETFAQKLTTSPGTYFVSAADALAVTNAVTTFAAAYAIAMAPEQRTPVNISAKDEARAAAEGVCRQFASLIKLNAGISNPDKIAAGVRPVNPDREPIECPQTNPLISPIAATQGSHTIRYADAMTPDERAKPFGASDLLLFCAVAAEHVTDPTLARFIGKFTKNPISVEFAAADNGKQATYFARWSSRKGDVGPWSIPVSLAIAA